MINILNRKKKMLIKKIHKNLLKLINLNKIIILDLKLEMDLFYKIQEMLKTL